MILNPSNPNNKGEAKKVLEEPTKKNLEQLLKDFPNSENTGSNAVLQPPFTVFSSGLSWFTGYTFVGHVGTPEEYLKVRNSKEKLKAYIATTLDKGWLYFDEDHMGGWGMVQDTRTSEYLLLLYLTSQNKTFTKNFEKASIELLEESLSKSYESFDFGKGLRRAKSDFQEKYGGSIDAFADEALINTKHMSVSLCQLKYNARDLYDDEVHRVQFMKDLEKTKKNGAYSVNRMERKSEFEERYLAFKAKMKALEEYSPQFYRLHGLLQIVPFLGDKSSLGKAEKMVQNAVSNSYLEHNPNIIIGAYNTRINLFETIVEARNCLFEASKKLGQKKASV